MIWNFYAVTSLLTFVWYLKFSVDLKFLFKFDFFNISQVVEYCWSKLSKWHRNKKAYQHSDCISCFLFIVKSCGIKILLFCVPTIVDEDIPVASKGKITLISDVTCNIFSVLMDGAWFVDNPSYLCQICLRKNCILFIPRSRVIFLSKKKSDRNGKE